MVALLNSYSSPIVRGGKTRKAVSPLDLERMQRKPRPESLQDLNDSDMEDEAHVIAIIMSQDEGEEGESDDEPEPSRGKGKGKAPVCETSANGEGQLLDVDFEEVYVNHGKRDGRRGKESDGGRG